jgi:hypothetical protein
MTPECAVQKKLSRLLLALTVAAALMGEPLAASVVLGQQKELSTKGDRYPSLFKVYSKDGRESLTASCKPIDLNPVVKHVTCEFTHVRFNPPVEQPENDLLPLTLTGEEVLRRYPEFAEEAEEARKNPKKFEEKWRNNREQLKQEFCQASSIIDYETAMGDTGVGPIRKSYFKERIAACSDKDSTVFFRHLSDSYMRMCNLWVDRFTLGFKMVRRGQWLYRQETPGLLSKVLKVYELTGEGLAWTLSETRVPTEGAEEKPTQTVWSWKNINNYELPCDFISHDQIQFP